MLSALFTSVQTKSFTSVEQEEDRTPFKTIHICGGGPAAADGRRRVQ